MAVMESNEPFNPITGMVGGAVLGAAGMGGYMGEAKLSYDRIRPRMEKLKKKQDNFIQRSKGYTPGSPNHQKNIEKALGVGEKITKLGPAVLQEDSHRYLNLPKGNWKKIGLVAASAAGAGILGAGAGYANQAWF